MESLETISVILMGSIILSIINFLQNNIFIASVLGAYALGIITYEIVLYLLVNTKEN